MAQEKQSGQFFLKYQYKYLLIPYYVPGTVLGPKGYSGEADRSLP